MVLLASACAWAQEPLRLENCRISLSFDRKSGALTAIGNKLTAEIYGICGDEWEVDAVEFHAKSADGKLASLSCQGEVVTARYASDRITVEVTYTLHGENHFVEKQLVLTGSGMYGLKKVTVSRPTFFCPGLQMVPYRYPKFGHAPGREPECTFFGRTAKGGLFTGLEYSFDSSALKGDNVILELAPGLKMRAGEKLLCEPAYFGVYQHGPFDKETQDLPLQSESDAMVAMTSAILGPPRFGLVPIMNGWMSQTERGESTEQSIVQDMKALDVMAQCGIDWYSDAHPWGGEISRMNGLGADDKYQPGPMVQKFLEHARKLNVKVMLFATLNNTHPWAGGKPFRLDRPDWLIDAGASRPANAPAWRQSGKGNCIGVRDFREWLDRIYLEAIDGGPYQGWEMDGDFFGGMGTVGLLVPADCQSGKHDHLPGNSDYASQKALTQSMAGIRQHSPKTYIEAFRPSQDLGIWALKYVDSCFTLDEYGVQSGNLAAGDKIRSWSRIRVHHNFFPHYIDQPQLFPGQGNWPSKNLDFILLSALSSSPNQTYYIPTKTGLPDADKAEIRKWLDWGRKNIEYLKVRKDLPDWPAAGKVDGASHIVGDHGLICLFNSSATQLTGEFALTEACIGLKATGNLRISQEYPASDRSIVSAPGQTVRWEVPPTTVIIIRIQPLEP